MSTSQDGGYANGDHERSRAQSLENLSLASGKVRTLLEFADFYLLVKERHSSWRFDDSEIMTIFLKYDADGDGAITPSEYRSMVKDIKKVKDIETCQRPYPRSSLEDLKGVQWFRQFFWIILNEFDYSPLAKSVQIFIMMLIIVSTCCIILESVQSLRGRLEFDMIEWVVSLIFTWEYIARFACCRSRRVFVFKPLNIVDVFSFLPFFIEVSGQVTGVADLRVVRTIRLSRMIRMLKMGFFADYVQIFAETLKFSKHSFGMLGFLLIFPIIIFACFIFSVEHKPGNQFSTIWDAMYFVVVTFTTLGYGDNYPITVLGKIIACFTVLVGIVYLTFAIQIIGNCFDQAYDNYLERVEVRKHAAATRLAKIEAHRRETVPADTKGDDLEKDSVGSEYSNGIRDSFDDLNWTIRNFNSAGESLDIDDSSKRATDSSCRVKGFRKRKDSIRVSTDSSGGMKDFTHLIDKLQNDSEVGSEEEAIVTPENEEDHISSIKKSMERRVELLAEKLPDNISRLSDVTNELTSILLLLETERLPKSEASTLFLEKFAELRRLLSV